jgi:hypothetical protein
VRCASAGAQLKGEFSLFFVHRCFCGPAKRKPDLRAPGIDHAGFALDASAAVCATNSLIGLHATLTAERLQAYVDRSTV